MKQELSSDNPVRRRKQSWKKTRKKTSDLFIQNRKFILL